MGEDPKRKATRTRTRTVAGGAAAGTRAWRLPVALALATVAGYAGLARNGFVNYDDPLYVADNPMVRGGLTAAGIEWAFTTFRADNWHPLTWFSHQLDAEIFGVGPLGTHLVNLGLHSACVVLLYAVLRAATGACLPSAAVAALFGLHPLHVEAVAWAAERKEVLAHAFFLLALGAHLRHARAPSLRRYLAVPALLALGLLAKPVLVTVPFLLLLLDWWPLGRLGRPAPRTSSAAWHAGPALPVLLEKLPLLALSLASAIVTVRAQTQAIWTFEQLPLLDRLANAALSYAKYLALAALPHGLAAIYPYPPPRALAAALAALALLALTALALAAARSRPHFAAGWLWYLGAMVPMIGIVQVGVQSMADRYTYLPLTGVFVAVAWEAAGAARRRPALARALALAGPVALAALGACTALQVRVWHDSLTLNSHAIENTSGNWIAHSNLGAALEAGGDNAGAERHYREAIRIKPGHVDAHVNLADILARRGQLDEALPHYEYLLRENPANAVAHAHLGRALADNGRPEEAIPHLQEALRRDPGFTRALPTLANALAVTGRTREAIQAFEEALRRDGEKAPTHVNLGLALVSEGRLGEAVAHYRRALDVDPGSFEAHLNLGNALAMGGRPAEAVPHLQEAIRARPDLAEAHANLGNAYRLIGASAQAEQAFAVARRLKPGLFAPPP